MHRCYNNINARNIYLCNTYLLFSINVSLLVFYISQMEITDILFLNNSKDVISSPNPEAGEDHRGCQ